MALLTRDVQTVYEECYSWTSQALSGVGLSLQPSVSCLIICIFPRLMVSHYRIAAINYAMPVSAIATPQTTVTSMIVRAQSTLPLSAASFRFTLQKRSGSTPRVHHRGNGSLLLHVCRADCLYAIQERGCMELGFKERKGEKRRPRRSS